MQIAILKITKIIKIIIIMIGQEIRILIERVSRQCCLVVSIIKRKENNNNDIESNINWVAFCHPGRKVVLCLTVHNYFGLNVTA